MNNVEGGRISPDQRLRTANKLIGAAIAASLTIGCVQTVEAESHQPADETSKTPGHELIVPMPQYNGSFIFANSAERNAEQSDREPVSTFRIERADYLPDGTVTGLVKLPKDPSKPELGLDVHYVEGKQALKSRRIASFGILFQLLFIQKIPMFV